MKFSRAIRMALEGKWMPRGLMCPICHEVAERYEPPGKCLVCPVNWDVAEDIGLSGASGNCIHWGHIATDDPDSPERIAAEELILCLEAQGD